MHVIVIGAGIAGLTAARVIADRADRVTIVERDRLPDRADDRPGVPQGHHPHALLVAGNDALEHLFPGLTDELATHGAVRADAAEDIAFWQLGAFRTRYHSGIAVVSATRALLELLIRRRVENGRKISLISGTHVRALIGVRAQRVDGIETNDGRQTRADLVIDATGSAGSNGWLHRLELPVPVEHRVRVNVGYATRHHLQGLRDRGLTPFHRTSYAPVRTFLLQPGRDPGKFCFGSLSSVAFGGLQCRTMKP